MTANLQTTANLTVKQAAILMNVSERSIYMVKKVLRLRPDLKNEIAAGKLSINAAHRIATNKLNPTSWDRLLTAWNAASAADRLRLWEAVHD